MEEKLLRTFGDRMRWARTRAQKSQTEVAEYCGARGHMTVAKWENADNFPGLGNLVMAAELYGVSIDWLVWGGDVARSIDGRVRKIPPMLRPGLIDRLHKEIDETEANMHRLPKEMLGEDVVKDADKRLSDWSAANLKKKKTKRETGSGTN